jgi:acetyltransferase-like isoleucine patch superfamily enzyme
MRKISGLQILIFSSTLTLIVILAVIIDVATFWHVPLADFRGVVMTVFGIFLIYVLAIATYRLMLWRFPLLPGEFPIASRQEFIYHVYILFFLLLFYPVMRSGIVPVPIMRLFYQALGARMGENSYSSGIMFDPSFVRMGKNCIIGQSAQIIPHAIEGERLAMYPILLGDNVTIGANAIVFADVVIGNNAIIAAGAVVSKGTRIRDGEAWGGVPAKRLK